MTVKQWIAGQLSNIYAISDLTLSRQALFQVIHTMRDAVLLPQPAVRTTWASFMHQIEMSDLTWPNSTQWAINRLSALQVALKVIPHTRASCQSARRTYMYVNEGSCSNESHHRSYEHFISFCSRQGKNTLRLNVILS